MAEEVAGREDTKRKGREGEGAGGGEKRRGIKWEMDAWGIEKGKKVEGGRTIREGMRGGRDDVEERA